MAISAVAASANTVGNTGGTNITITSPTGTQAADVLVCVIAEHGNAEGVSQVADSGGTLLFTKLGFGAQATTASTSVWYRVVQAGDPTTWTITNTEQAEAALMAYRGVDPAIPIDAQGTTNTASTSPCTFNALTTQSDGAWYVGAFAENLATAGLNALTSGSPTPTIRANAGNGGTTSTRQAVGLIDVAQTAAGPVGTFQYSLNTANAWGTFSFALRPAAVFPIPYEVGPVQQYQSALYRM